MFYAQYSKIDAFLKIMETIQNFVDNINIAITSLGISVESTDILDISLIYLFISKSDFKDFICEKQMRIGISLNLLIKALKTGKNEDNLTFRYNDGDYKLNIKLENTGKIIFFIIIIEKKRKREFWISILEIEKEKYLIPDIECKSFIKLPFNEFFKMISELYSIDEIIKIEGNNNYVKFSIKNKEIKGEYIYLNNSEFNDKKYEINIHKKVKFSFSLFYLYLLNKIGILTDCVIIYLFPNFPLIIEFIIDQGTTIKFHLAPKIDNFE